jgi:hypothetical protein
MTHLTRRDLRYFARMLMLANTPASLLHGLRSADAMSNLVRSDPIELAQFYDRITARAKRTEIELSLAYATLVAALLNAAPPQLDASRLAWGEDIAEILRKGGATSQRVILDATPKPQVTTRQFAANVPTIILPGGPSWSD